LVGICRHELGGLAGWYYLDYFGRVGLIVVRLLILVVCILKYINSKL